MALRIARMLQCSASRWRGGKVACPSLLRAFSSSSSDLVLTTIDEESGIATMQLNRPPVNSLSLEMCQAISSSIKQAEAAPVQSLILSSSLPSILSAGLDIMEMHKPDEKRLAEFWSSFQQVYLDLYGSRLACIAAIQGHAPAAGCMLTLCCDYRIMAASSSELKPTIGLNESKLGIVAPPWLAQLFMDTVGHREAEKGLSLGLLYSPEEALDIGLVDEVVPKSEVMEKSREQALVWSKIPSQARVASKQLTRKKQLDHLLATRQADIDHFCGFVNNDMVQRNIAMYLESLKKKKKSE